MEEEHFLALIREYGEENILGFLFDNTGRVLFTPKNAEGRGRGNFTLAEFYKPEYQSLVVLEQQNGTEWIAVKPINTIQGVVLKTPNTVVSRLDVRMLSN